MTDRFEITTHAIGADRRCSAHLCSSAATYLLKRSLFHPDAGPAKVEWFHYCDIDLAAAIRNSAALFFEEVVMLRRQRAGDSSVAS